MSLANELIADYEEAGDDLGQTETEAQLEEVPEVDDVIAEVYEQKDSVQNIAKLRGSQEQEKCISILTAKVNQQLESFKHMEDLEGNNEVPSRKVILKQNRYNEEHSKMQRKYEEGKGSEGTDQELAIVEYNHQKFYLGIFWDENTFIFCKEPIAKVQKEKFTYNISKMSMKLDRKDEQIIDTAYVVCKFLGHVTKDIISMKTINKESLETQIRNYLK